MYAVTSPFIRVIYFLRERPADPDLQVEEGVRVEPLDFLTGSIWPEGAPRPEQVLCRSKKDPKFYKQFKYRADFDPADFEELDKGYGGIHTRHQFDQIRRRVHDWNVMTKALAEIPDDPTGTDEAWDDILHNLGVDPAGGERSAR